MKMLVTIMFNKSFHGGGIMALFEVKPLPKFSFPNGSGVDILNGPLHHNEFGCLAIFSVSPKGVRANHYHTDKVENVFAVAGAAKLVLVDVKTRVRQETELRGDRPALVKIFPNVAHAFVNQGDETFTAIFYGEKPHLEDNPATVLYKVA